ncbi:sulfotransferase [Parvicella tangerina]|uniref:Sulfotransferase domain-containing protein n=1 Tax=Parvicella tangerina TaxID=2829795 RepID=A0A916NAM9_9FLAO|nr:sulfotransferase [Parvicella tangerina]CAG5081032.1 hypothetical protein CRYO30217_01518 [Parvicella tangerina]
MNNGRKDNIILFSVPRSGSSWLSEVLTFHQEIRLVHEPDNEINSIFGLLHKIGLHRFPFLKEKDDSNSFIELFATAFNFEIVDHSDWQNKLIKKILRLSNEKLQRNVNLKGIALDKSIPLDKIWKRLVTGKRTNKRTLIKSVHASLAIPFLVDNIDFIPVVLKRHPLNTFSSYTNMGMPDGNRKLYLNRRLLSHFGIESIDSPIEKSSSFLSGYQLGVFEVSYIKNQSYESIHFVDYESVISNPFEEVHQLCEKLNINFGTHTKTFMESKFKRGDGYKTNRDISDHHTVWKNRLTTKQVDDFLKGYELAFGSINFEV